MTEQQEKYIQLTNYVNSLLEAGKVLTDEYKTPLLDIISKLEDFSKTLSTKTIDDLTEADKDSLYGEYKDLMTKLFDVFKTTKYIFELTLDEYKFLSNQFHHKIKFNRQDNVIALSVKEEIFNVFESLFTKNVAKAENNFTIEELTRLSLINAKIELTGFSKDNYQFNTISEKIGNVSRVYEWVDATSTKISTEVHNYFAALEPEETVTNN